MSAQDQEETSTVREEASEDRGAESGGGANEENGEVEPQAVGGACDKEDSCHAEGGACDGMETAVGETGSSKEAEKDRKGEVNEKHGEKDEESGERHEKEAEGMTAGQAGTDEDQGRGTEKEMGNNEEVKKESGEEEAGERKVEREGKEDSKKEGKDKKEEKTEKKSKGSKRTETNVQGEKQTQAQTAKSKQTEKGNEKEGGEGKPKDGAGAKAKSKEPEKQSKTKRKMGPNPSSSPMSTSPTPLSLMRPRNSARSFRSAAKKDIMAKFQQNCPDTPVVPNFKVQRSTGGFSNGASIKQKVLQWCRNKTRNYEGVSIENFSSSWCDGLAFCALVHRFFPDAFDFSTLRAEEREKNFTLAFSTAESKADCCPLLEVSDMLLMGNAPDPLCVFTYVQALCQHLSKIEKQRKESEKEEKGDAEEEKANETTGERKGEPAADSEEGSTKQGENEAHCQTAGQGGTGGKGDETEEETRAEREGKERDGEKEREGAGEEMQAAGVE